MTADASGAYRRDRMSGDWVLVTPERGGVPRARDPLAGLPEPGGPCPFCPGHEAETEATVHAWPSEDRWRIRVVGNRYPAVRARSQDTGGGNARRERPPHGYHEVVVEAPEHDLELEAFSPEHAREVLRVYRARVRALERHEGIRHVAVFRNRGRRAGSSQPHPHGQILAAAVCGPEVERRAVEARRHAEGHQDTLLEAVVADELAQGARVVEANDGAVSFCPFAPHRAYETWIAARGESSRGSFGEASDAAIEAVAQLLPSLVGRVRAASGRSDYTLLLRCPPVGEPAGAAFWYLQILPAGGGAGFELSTGIDLVPVHPEGAARALRHSGP